MSTNLHAVFSQPPAHVSAEQFNEWYDAHLAELLVIPGFQAARRYRITPNREANGPTRYGYLSLYEIDDNVDLDAAITTLHADGMQDHMDLPSWMHDIQFASWNLRGLGNPTEPALADHLLFVFSHPPEEISAADYIDWYVGHLAENLTVDNYDAGWRFSVDPDVVDQMTPPIWSHLGIYQLSADMATLTANRARFKAEGRLSEYPDWFSGISFASGEGTALGPRTVADPAKKLTVAAATQTHIGGTS